MSNFKVGDVVKINPESGHYGQGDNNPKDAIGTVTSFLGESETYKYKVTWPNGSRNQYRDEDLLHWGEFKPREDTLIAEAKERYPKGTIFLSAESGRLAEAFHDYEYDESTDKLCDDGWAVYYKGKWAEIEGATKQINKFKEGDRIIGNSHAKGLYDITTEGWVGYVYKVSKEEILVGDAVKESDSSNHPFWVDPDCFDLCTESSSPKRKFKVGDIIIGNEHANKYSVTIEGWIGRVTKVISTEMIEAAHIDSPESDTFRLHEYRFDLYKEESLISSSIKTSENGKAKHDDSGCVIKVPQLDFEVSRANQIRGSRIDGSTVEVTIGNRHRNYETRSIRG